MKLEYSLIPLVLVTQLCPLCDPMDDSPPGSSVHGILQAKILEWVAIPSSRVSSQCRDRTWVSPALQADSLPSEPPGEPTGINPEWIKDLNVRPETLKLTEENIDGTLSDINFSHISLDLSLKAKGIKGKNKQMETN